jgi:ABC-type transport system substrate-binding protein
MAGDRNSRVAWLLLCCLSLALPNLLLAQEGRGPRGTLKVVDFWNSTRSVTVNFAEGLVDLDKDGNIVPGLATEWRWVDDRTLELNLRKGVKFHNGEMFNAGVVRLNWEHYSKLKVPVTPNFLRLQVGSRLEVIDEYTVRFTFPEPDGIALSRLRFFFLIAPEYFTRYDFGEMKWGLVKQAGPWGTGPFRLVEGNLDVLKPGDRVELEAYDQYWDQRYPKVRTVVFEQSLARSRDEAVRLCRENEGQADVVIFIRPIDTLRIAESPFAKTVKSRDFTQTHSAINQRKPDSKWRDIRLRQALNCSLDREELLQYGAKGNAYNLGGHIPPGARGHNPDLKPFSYDPTRARSLLAQAGYPDGFEMKMVAPDASELEATVMKRMYERVGFKVRLEVFPFHVWLRKVWPLTERDILEQDWDISVCYNNDFFGHSGMSHLIWPFLEGSGMRWIELDPTYEGMWKDMAATLDAGAQDRKIQQLEQYIFDRAYVVFIYSPLTLYAVNKEVEFVPQKYMFLRLKETAVTDNHWSVRSN